MKAAARSCLSLTVLIFSVEVGMMVFSKIGTLGAVKGKDRPVIINFVKISNFKIKCVNLLGQWFYFDSLI